MAERLTAADLVRRLEQSIDDSWEEMALLPDDQKNDWLAAAAAQAMPLYYWDVFDVCQSDLCMCRVDGQPDTLAIAREAIRRRLAAHACDYAAAKEHGDEHGDEYD